MSYKIYVSIRKKWNVIVIIIYFSQLSFLFFKCTAIGHPAGHQEGIVVFGRWGIPNWLFWGDNLIPLRQK